MKGGEVVECRNHLTDGVLNMAQSWQDLGWFKAVPPSRGSDNGKRPGASH